MSDPEQWFQICLSNVGGWSSLLWLQCPPWLICPALSPLAPTPTFLYTTHFKWSEHLVPPRHCHTPHPCANCLLCLDCPLTPHRPGELMIALSQATLKSPPVP